MTDAEPSVSLVDLGPTMRLEARTSVRVNRQRGAALVGAAPDPFRDGRYAAQTDVLVSALPLEARRDSCGDQLAWLLPAHVRSARRHFGKQTGRRARALIVPAECQVRRFSRAVRAVPPWPGSHAASERASATAREP